MHPRFEFLRGHVNAVHAIAFSPDGGTLVSGGLDGEVKVWDVATGRLLCTQEREWAVVWAVAFSPDGQILAAAGEEEGPEAGYEIKLWHAPDGALLWTIATRWVDVLAFAPDAHTLAVGGADWLALLCTQTGQVLWEIDLFQDWIAQLVFPQGPPEYVESCLDAMSFSADGARLMIRSNSFRASLDARTGTVEWAIPEPESPAVWESLSWHYYEHAYQNVMVCSTDERLVARRTVPEVIELSDSVTGAPLLSVDHGQLIRVFTFSPDGRLLVTAGDPNLIKLWEIPGGRLVHTLGGEPKCVPGPPRFSPDGKLLAGTVFDHAICMWDVATGHLRRLPTDTARVFCLDFGPQGTWLASGGEDGSVKLWDVQTGAVLRSWKAHRESVIRIAVSPDGSAILTAERRSKTLHYEVEIRLWDARTEQLRWTWAEPGAAIYQIAFAPDGEAVAAIVGRPGQSAHAVLFNACNGAVEREFPSSDDQIHNVYGIAFSPNDGTLAEGHIYRKLFLWDPITGGLKRTLQMTWDGTDVLAFTPDGKGLATAAVLQGWHREVNFWDVETGQLQRSFAGHRAEITGVAVGPDGAMLASGSADGTIKLWNIQSGRLLVTLIVLPAAARERVASDWLAFTPEGYYVASPGAGRHVRWRAGHQVFPLETCAAAFHRPDLVSEALTRGASSAGAG
jgi:WD40 repeat protein